MSKKKSAAVVPWEVTAGMFLSESEVDSLLRHLQERETDESVEVRRRAIIDRLIVELLLFSGLRNSELCYLRVVDTSIGHGQGAVQVSGTPKQDRLVYIPQSLNEAIVHFIKDTRRGCVLDGLSPDDVSQPLILNERGRPYDRTALYRRVVRILGEAGLEERASVQLLRHTYGYLAYKRTGGNLLFVQRQMGHAHPMVTAVYSQFVEFSDADLAAMVGGALAVTNQTVSKRKSQTLRKKVHKNATTVQPRTNSRDSLQ